MVCYIVIQFTSLCIMSMLLHTVHDALHTLCVVQYSNDVRYENNETHTDTHIYLHTQYAHAHDIQSDDLKQD